MENKRPDTINNSSSAFVWGGHYSSYLPGYLAFFVNKRPEEYYQCSAEPTPAES
jgi:hypothetical protein